MFARLPLDWEVPGSGPVASQLPQAAREAAKLPALANPAGSTARIHLTEAHEFRLKRAKSD